MAGAKTGAGKSSRSGSVTRLRRKALTVKDHGAGQTPKQAEDFSTSSGLTRNLCTGKPGLVEKHSSVNPDLEMEGKEVDGFLKSRDKALGNALVVGLICSFMSSQADFLSLRLVNHLFQKEATNSWRKAQKHFIIHDNAVTRVQQLVLLAKKREALGLTPFPFCSFDIHVHEVRRETVKSFSATIGRHVNRYYLRTHVSFNRQDCFQIGGRVAVLLSQSPSLAKLEIESSHELFLSEKDYLHVSIPTFPKLGILAIEIVRKGYHREHSHKNLYPLLDILVNRATQLKRLMIPGVEAVSMRILRFLLETRSNNLPSLSFDKEGLYVHPSTIPIIRELMNTHLLFTDITLDICGKYSWTDTPDQNDVQNTLYVVTTKWLETQSKCLTNLCINFMPGLTMASLPLPALRALKNLTISFSSPRFGDSTLPSNCRPVLPFVDNPFPVLETLRIDHYRNDFAMFGTCSLPSLQHLQIYCPISPVTDPSWPVVFPNITTLNLNIEINKQSTLNIRPTLAFILTHFTRVVHLKLDFRNTNCWYSTTRTFGEFDVWDILTGGAPRAGQNSAFSVRKFVEDAGEAEEPLDGVYRVPSLRNMTALKTFSISPKLRINIDAILYMSRAGFLLPLDRLILKDALFDIREDWYRILKEQKKTAPVSRKRSSELSKLDEAGFGERLAKFHKEVMMGRY